MMHDDNESPEIEWIVRRALARAAEVLEDRTGKRLAQNPELREFAHRTVTAAADEVTKDFGPVPADRKKALQEIVARALELIEDELDEEGI